MLCAKETLDPGDFVDNGLNRRPTEPRFCLVPKLLNRASRIVAELQSFLITAAKLIPEREAFFRVDPDDYLLEVLRGCSDLGQLFVAWKLLRRRIELGMEFLEKYDIEYKEEASPPSLSQLTPVSTGSTASSYLPIKDSRI